MGNNTRHGLNLMLAHIYTGPPNMLNIRILIILAQQPATETEIAGLRNPIHILLVNVSSFEAFTQYSSNFHIWQEHFMNKRLNFHLQPFNDQNVKSQPFTIKSL